MEIQDFTFKVAPYDNDPDDIMFVMGIGNHFLSTDITGWSNSWESISEKLEEYIFSGQSIIELDFDTEPTTITIKRDGKNVFLDIEPSYFTKDESFNGYCLEKEFLSKLYYGLLYAMTFLYDEVGCGWNWSNCKMVCYNRLKSRTIEEYLRTGVVERISPFVTKHVLVIDNEEILHICDETIGYHIPIVEETKVYDKRGKVIATIDSLDLRKTHYSQITDSLSPDFDLWILRKQDDIYIEPRLIERNSKAIQGELFDKGKYEVTEKGEDPYGFTSDTLWTACNDLDIDNVAFFLSLNADTTYILKWILNSNKGGTIDSVGNPTYDETEDSIRKRDEQKADIIRYVLSHVSNIQLSEYHLKECVWNYSPSCLRLLLEYGANPNEKTIDPDWQLFTVKYRSVLSLTNSILSEKEEKYGIITEMKKTLETFGAEDIVIWNEEHPSFHKLKNDEELNNK